MIEITLTKKINKCHVYEHKQKINVIKVTASLNHFETPTELKLSKTIIFD